jgi:hypothetical protein
MKNKIYYLGMMACIITTCGCLFKIQHWAGGDTPDCRTAILALAFIPLAIGSLYKAESNKRLRTFYVLTAIIVDINLISALFKVMHWPYAGSLLLISFPLPFLVLLPVFLFSSPEEKLINYRNFLAVMFFWLLCFHHGNAHPGCKPECHRCLCAIGIQPGRKDNCPC